MSSSTSIKHFRAGNCSTESFSTGHFHALILEGENLLALFDAARERCAALLCEQGGCGKCPVCRKVQNGQHPDISVLRSEDKLIPVGAVRELRSSMWVRPNEGRHKIIVLGDAAKLNLPAQNALLNLIEEPPAYGVIMLLTTSRGALLPTIRSRCAFYRDADSQSQGFAVDSNIELLIVALIKQDELAVLRAALPLEKIQRSELESALNYMELRLSEILIENKSLTRAQLLRMIEVVSAKRAALSVNAGAGHVCAAMAAELWECLMIGDYN